MLGGADNPNGELPSYITGADMCGSGVPVTTTCHCCAVVFLQSRRMRRSLHTLRCVRPLRLMAQLSLPVCRRTAACSPQTDFPGVHT